MTEVLDLISTPEESSPYIRGIIYGPPKVGKTTLVGGAPAPLILDFDKGAKVLFGQSVKVFKYEGFDSVIDLILAFREEKLPDIRTVVLDTVTEFLYKELDAFMRTAAITNKNRNPYVAFQSDYGEVAQMLRTIVMAFAEMPVHLLILAHAKEADDIEGKFVRPSVSPKVYETISALVDFIAYYNRIGSNRTLRFEPTNRITAGTRIPMPAELVNPKFSDILEAFERTRTRG